MSSRQRHCGFVIVVCVLVVAVSLFASAAGGAATARATAQTGPNPCVGTITEQPDNRTLVSIQGAQETSHGYVKRPALLASYAPDGSFVWTRNATAHGRWWAYDVDPLPNGTLLFATTQHGASVVGELDPTENEYVWLERFDGPPDAARNPQVTDAHDVDQINGDELAIVDKGEGHERLLVYDRSADRVVWEWRFADHPEYFPEDGGGGGGGWTHVNDIDLVNASESDAVEGEGEWFMASVRNFDQVVFVNRSSKQVELVLGEDENTELLFRQHNPDHLWGPNGEHTVLVADSRNDRVVEYEYDTASESWDRVWSMHGFDEPRDADRLPNGNTVIADRMGHRVVEVTPSGEVVWEVYTPYEPYDVERGEPGSNGPTMREAGVSGRFETSGEATFTSRDVHACADSLFSYAPSTLDVLASDATGRDTHRGESPVLVLLVAGALGVLLAVVAGFVVYRSRR